jgi:hypothetical protein
MNKLTKKLTKLYDIGAFPNINVFWDELELVNYDGDEYHSRKAMRTALYPIFGNDVYFIPEFSLVSAYHKFIHEGQKDFPFITKYIEAEKARHEDNERRSRINRRFNKLFEREVK